MGERANAQKSPGVAAAATPTLSLQAISQAARQHDHSIVQIRRFRDKQGGVVAVREHLQVDADGTDSPPYSLTFLGVEGELPGSVLQQQWQQTYHRLADQFYHGGNFRIRDLTKAVQNYTLHDFGVVVRANRTAHRVVVFPQQLDKAIWVLEIDAETFLPLYTAEYDVQLRLLAELEAVSFSRVALVTSASLMGKLNFPQPSFADAKAFLGDPAGLVEPPPGLLGEYTLSKVEVREDPLNSQKSLVLCYTDGVDEFFVTEAPGTSEFLAGLPSQQQTGARAPNTIARYRDHAMSVLLFWDDGVSFQVAGRGSLQRLDHVARSIYSHALLGN